MRKIKFLLLAFLFTAGSATATTWDEPWADKVIREAASFVLAKVTEVDHEKGVTIRVIRTLAGKELKDSLVITDFYLLNICSSSGHGPEFRMARADSCYFFIKQNETGAYCIATPTTGFGYVKAGQVMATYRHSYHQAAVPVTVYEKTMTAIFQHYHHLAYDKTYIDQFVKEQLSQKPAGFAAEEVNIFFLQHAALETVFHLGMAIDAKLALPFLNDSTNFHNQVSGARALAASKGKAATEALLRVIVDTGYRNFVKVICIQSLEKLDARYTRPQLLEITKTASGEADGFGGNIMDPRVCTHVPSLKEALDELLAKW
ncbi:MAG: hypothetical protein ABW019_14830 [Chitinophagaceae bacterium]